MESILGILPSLFLARARHTPSPGLAILPFNASPVPGWLIGMNWLAVPAGLRRRGSNPATQKNEAKPAALFSRQLQPPAFFQRQHVRHFQNDAKPAFGPQGLVEAAEQIELRLWIPLYLGKKRQALMVRR